MALSRRQLLIGGGIIAGGSLALLSQRLVGKPSLTSAGLPTTAPAIARTPTPVAPEGLYAPVRGDVRLAVISDLNSSYGSTTYDPEVTQAVQLIPGWQPDIVLCSGDMVAGQKLSLSVAEVQAMWAGFDRAIAAPLRQAKLPYGFTVGNHDASSSPDIDGSYVFERDRQQAAAYWNQPTHDPGLTFVDRAKFPFYYTFEHQQIFYLVWDASSHLIPKEQLQWVERSLASPQAQQAKLRIAIGHLPLYAVAVGRDRPGEILSDAEQLRLLLEKYQVHTYISGHAHAYYPAHKGKLQLLHTGALGSGPRRWLNSDLEPMKTLTIVDVSLEKADTTYTTYNMTTLKPIDQTVLPQSIAGSTGVIFRRDIRES